MSLEQLLDLDRLLDFESLVSLCIAGLFFATVSILLHPRTGGNSLKRPLVIVAITSCLFFVASSSSLLVGDVLTQADVIYRLILVRTVTRVLLPVSFFYLVYKVVKARHEEG